MNKNYQRGGSQLPPSDDIIITFYSDRNLKERMIFKESVPYLSYCSL